MAARRTVGGPGRHYVDASGRYAGEFRDAVDAETGEVMHAVALPDGLVEVAGPPPAPGKLWDGAAWIDDPAYVPPPPSLEQRLDALEQALIAKAVLTRADLDAQR